MCYSKDISPVGLHIYIYICMGIGVRVMGLGVKGSEGDGLEQMSKLTEA